MEYKTASVSAAGLKNSACQYTGLFAKKYNRIKMANAIIKLFSFKSAWFIKKY
jgi:hypothetical protein